MKHRFDIFLLFFFFLFETMVRFILILNLKMKDFQEFKRNDMYFKGRLSFSSATLRTVSSTLQGESLSVVYDS